MIIGSILSVIIIVLVILGLTKNSLQSFRASNIALIAALVLCPLAMMIPAIRIGGRFSFSIGGFILPLAAVVYLAFTLGWNRNLVRAALGALAVAVVTGLGYMFVPFSPTVMLITTTLIVGIVAGGIAYLVAGTSNGGFAAALLGVILADVAVFIINAIRGVTPALALGSMRSFDIFMIAGIMAVVLHELARMYRVRTMSNPNVRQSLKYEFGDDFNYHTSIEQSDEEYRDEFIDR